jgi:translation initiation factor 1
MDQRRLVYSTDGGLPVPQPRREKRRKSPDRPNVPDDGTIRIAKERRRAGVVTVVHGLSDAELEEAATALKRSCGTGGTIRKSPNLLELQGDHRERVAAFFESKGRRVKRIGG